MSQLIKQYTLTYEQMHGFVKRLATVVQAPLTILLEGDLGAGKTTLARFLIQTLVGAPCEVPSPTFTLVQTYDSLHGAIHHYDLYRLKRCEEAIELGIEESLATAITLIEWPRIIDSILPANYLRLHLHLVSDSQRLLECETEGSLEVPLQDFIQQDLL